MNKKEIQTKSRKFAESIDKLTRKCDLPIAHIICALEQVKLDIMLNDGLVIINGKVGAVKKK